MRESIVSQPMHPYRFECQAAITIMGASGCARDRCEHAVDFLDLQPYIHSTAYHVQCQDESAGHHSFAHLTVVVQLRL